MRLCEIQATRVILWPDTFSNHFHPSIAIAATEVLEAANCDVLGNEDAMRLSQQSFLLSEFQEAILKEMGVRLESLDSGCCGMAGSFGFEADHYDVSMAVGELVLLPAVRRASPDTLIVADGFSCREQIRQATSKRALHLAEVLRLGAAR